MRNSLATCLTLTLCFLTIPAFADRIDGDWCNQDNGKALFIEGDSIRTPSGAETIGQNGHHSFRYDGVSGTEEEGQAISMQQYSDDDMRLTRDGGPSEQWRRCKPVA